jgi:hypothetical protein|tara:strand:- start:140 stop:274 length:135 start_codon:yes stop_codon:yes gene_type:complete
MIKLLNKLFAINLYGGNPLRYRENQFTLAELEKRLTEEVNGRRK